MEKIKKKVVLATEKILLLKTNKAFTLIEVLVVLMIIGFALGVVIPQTERIFRTNLKLAASNIAGAIKYSFDYAIMNQKTTRIVFDFEKNYYFIENANPGVLISLKEEEEDEEKDPAKEEKIFSKITGLWSRNLILPSGVFFDSVLDQEHNIEIKENIAYMYFFPHGQTQALIIRLKSKNSGFYSLKVNPITADIRIYGRFIDE